LTKIRRNVVAGILTFIPIWITVWVISFLVGVLVALGSPLVRALVSWLGIHSPTLAEGFSAEWFQGTISVAIVLAALYLLGEIATAVAGRRLLAAFDYLMARIPIVQSISGNENRRPCDQDFQRRRHRRGDRRRLRPDHAQPNLGLHGVGSFEPPRNAGLDNQ
jgi:hypothetical protein